MHLLKVISLIASIVLPLWNIPLIARVIKRKSSNDISLFWAVGVWICFVLMLPSGLTSPDIVFKAFTISNILLFSIVTAVVVMYHHR